MLLCGALYGDLCENVPLPFHLCLCYICRMKTSAKQLQLQNMQRESMELLKQMDAQVKKEDYEGLRKTLDRSREVRKRMAIIMKGQ